MKSVVLVLAVAVSLASAATPTSRPVTTEQRVPAADTIGGLEALVKESALLSPDYTRLGALFAARTNAPNINIINHIVNGVGAGLLAVSKGDLYTQRIRPFVSDPAALEDSLRIPCTKCANEGSLTRTCPTCNGSRRCQNTGCANGVTARPVFDGGSIQTACSVCKGSGQCAKCNGEGNVTTTCATCMGKKAVFSPNKASSVYVVELQAALDGFESIRTEKARRLAQEAEERAKQAELAESKVAAAAHAERLRQAEVEGRTVAAAAEGEALGKERARLAVEEQRRRVAEEEDRKRAERDRQFLAMVVIIEGESSVGTGFFCDFKGKRVVMSNAHVLCGNRSPVIKTIGGDAVAFTKIHVCKVRDVVVYELADPLRYGVLQLYDGSKMMNNQEQVVVFGNSGGGGVVTTLRGKMQGIGPVSIEVDATFIAGNSGSPIIAYDYDKVVGMATYVQKDGKVDWTTKDTRFGDVRRFGVRVDNLEWTDFESLDMGRYRDHIETVQRTRSFADDVLAKAKASRGRYTPSLETREAAAVLLKAHDSLPEWIQKYSDDAKIGALVCRVILDNDNND